MVNKYKYLNDEYLDVEIVAKAGEKVMVKGRRATCTEDVFTSGKEYDFLTNKGLYRTSIRKKRQILGVKILS